MSFDTLATALGAAVAALRGAPRAARACAQADERELLDLTRLAAEARRLLEATSAALAGEIASRSHRDLGAEGLAQRSGFRTPEELVRVVAGSSGRDAAAVVAIGRLVRAAESATSGTDEQSRAARPAVDDEREPWLRPVGEAVAAGRLSLASAEAIRSGLGRPGPSVSLGELERAAARLCAEAVALDPDRVARRARELRADLDRESVAANERARREARSLRMFRTADGMTRLVWTMDPETAAVAGDVYDRATSPRRGGPRFVDPARSSEAERILADPRTTEQLASDVFLELLRQGAEADPSRLLGTGGAVVRVLVDERSLRERTGRAHIEGQAEPVSIETAERMTCCGGIVPIVFDDEGQALNVGREQRLFTARQRIALAARDGGCRWPGCDRPPSWSEAHHVRHWVRDGGRTDIADGVLLCRHHHLLLHNNHWEIERRRGEYWLVPPPDVDARRQPIAMPSTSGALRDLLRSRAG